MSERTFTDEEVEAAARAHSPRAWKSFDEWFATHKDGMDRHQYHNDLLRAQDQHLSAMRAALSTLTLPVKPDLHAARERLCEAAVALVEQDAEMESNHRYGYDLSGLVEAARAYAALAGQTT